MPKRGPASDLAEIEAAIDRIAAYTCGMAEGDFEASMIAYDAVAMNMIVNGEAVRRLETEVTALEANVPWREIIGLRNRIAHGYEDIEPTWLWRIIQDDLPELKQAVARLTGRFPPG